MTSYNVIPLDVWKIILLPFSVTELYRILFVCKNFQIVVNTILNNSDYKAKHKIPQDINPRNLLSSIRAMKNLLDGIEPTIIGHGERDGRFGVFGSPFRISSNLKSNDFLVFDGQNITLCTPMKNEIVEKNLDLKLIQNTEDAIENCKIIYDGVFGVFLRRFLFDGEIFPSFCFILKNGIRIDIPQMKDKYIASYFVADKWVICLVRLRKKNKIIGFQWILKIDIEKSKEKLILNKNFFSPCNLDLFWKNLCAVTPDGSFYILNGEDCVSCYYPEKENIRKETHEIENIPAENHRRFVLFAFNKIHVLFYNYDDLLIHCISISILTSKSISAPSKKMWSFSLTDFPPPSETTINGVIPILYKLRRDQFDHYFEYNDHLFIVSKTKTAVYYWSRSSWENEESPFMTNLGENCQFLNLPFGILLTIKKKFARGKNTASAFSIIDPLHSKETTLFKEGEITCDFDDIHPHPRGIIYTCREKNRVPILFADYSFKKKKSFFPHIDFRYYFISSISYPLNFWFGCFFIALFYYCYCYCI